MKKRARLVVSLTVFAGALLPALSAHAQCCAGYSPATACSGVTLTKSRWCIQNSVPTGQNALPKAFCSYGDKVVTTLEKTFNIPAPDIFEFELDTQTGGAHTGTACNHFGDGVAYDAFAGKAYNATGFWGYLLAMHEAINDWTGLASSGWPTDWWADHQSAFPNLMDFHIMNTVGVDNNDMNLITAAAAQKKRFYPGGDSADAKVVALDNVFNAMPKGDGFAGFSTEFSLQTADGVKWDNLGVRNPDVKRSEYVAAYMSLALGKSALPFLQGPGENGGGKICNNTPDGTPSDQPYTCNQSHIDAIATAHCSIAANGKPAGDLSALRAGNYATVASGPCGSTCPTECGCDEAAHCVAAWLAKPATAGGGGAGGTPATAGAGGAAVAGSAGIGGSTSMGGSLGGGEAVPNGGGTTPSGGSPGSAGTSTASGGASAGSGGAIDPGTDAGCSCRAAGSDPSKRNSALLFASTLGLMALSRIRTRRRLQ